MVLPDRETPNTENFHFKSPFAYALYNAGFTGGVLISKDRFSSVNRPPGYLADLHGCLPCRQALSGPVNQSISDFAGSGEVQLPGQDTNDIPGDDSREHQYGQKHKPARTGPAGPL